MSAKRIQLLLAAVFLVLGGWCLVWPSSVLDLAVRPEWRSDDPIVPVLMAAFGAQAMIAGLFAATATFTRTTFAAYGGRADADRSRPARRRRQCDHARPVLARLEGRAASLKASR